MHPHTAGRVLPRGPPRRSREPQRLEPRAHAPVQLVHARLLLRPRAARRRRGRGRPGVTLGRGPRSSSTAPLRLLLLLLLAAPRRRRGAPPALSSGGCRALPRRLPSEACIVAIPGLSRGQQRAVPGVTPGTAAVLGCVVGSSPPAPRPRAVMRGLGRVALAQGTAPATRPTPGTLLVPFLGPIIESSLRPSTAASGGATPLLLFLLLARPVPLVVRVTPPATARGETAAAATGGTARMQGGLRVVVIRSAPSSGSLGQRGHIRGRVPCSGAPARRRAAAAAVVEWPARGRAPRLASPVPIVHRQVPAAWAPRRLVVPLVVPRPPSP